MGIILGQQVFFFAQERNFFLIFFEGPKRIMFRKVVHDYDFACCLCVLWFPSYPQIIFKGFSCFIMDFGGWFSVKVSKFLVFSQKGVLIFIQTKAGRLSDVLHGCICCPLAIWAKFAGVLIDRGTLN